MSDEQLKKLSEEGARPGAEKKVKRGFFSYFKKNQSRIPFGEKIETLYEWMVSGKLSTRDRAVVIGTLIYFINPLDVIPDMTPFLGFTDDIGLVLLVYNYLQNRSIEEKKGPDPGPSQKK